MIEYNNKDKSNLNFLINYIINPKENIFVKYILNSSLIGYMK